MALRDALLPDFDHEMATTRRVLERVPDTDFDWKPHPKSMTLGQLAGHLATLPKWCASVFDVSVLDLGTVGPDARPREPASRTQLLADFDQRVAAARAGLIRQTDPELLAPWTLKHGGHEIFTLPRISALRSFIMNHSIHHRGQLTVYLRLKEVPVPPVYGPTADEQ
jgi:uncharacterized damage-inducible protein DinB